MKKSIQWDMVGIFALVMAFVSFFAFIFSGAPTFRNNMLLIGLSNPLLIVVFTLFAFMSFIFGYLESRKEEGQLGMPRPMPMQIKENPQEDPLQLLKVRLAKGEITYEEYEKTRETLAN